MHIIIIAAICAYIGYWLVNHLGCQCEGETYRQFCQRHARDKTPPISDEQARKEAWERIHGRWGREWAAAFNKNEPN
jgi:hypothetical protein